MPYRDKAHQSAAARRHYLKNTVKMKARARAHRPQATDRARAVIRRIKEEAGCKGCGIKDFRVLDFHHRNPSEKEFDVATGVTQGYGVTRLLAEIAKCDVQCANCHRILEWEARRRSSEAEHGPHKAVGVGASDLGALPLEHPFRLPAEGKAMMSMNERSKIKTLVHYVAYRCADRPSVLSAVKLNKVLWYADLTAYLQWGAPITRATYIKKDRGPVVSELMPVVQQLENEKNLAIRRMPTLGGYKDKVEYLALTRPDVNNILTAEEITLIEDVIQNVCHKHTGRSSATLARRRGLGLQCRSCR